METFLLSFLVIVLASVGLAVGLLIAGKPLKGTCATLGEETNCEACGCAKRDETLSTGPGTA